MKITLFNAISVNGYVARENYREDFLSDYDWKTFCNLAKKFGCLILGRKTYEIAKNSKDFNFNDIKNVKKIIVSKNRKFADKNNICFATSPKDAINKSKLSGFKETLLCSGGNLNSEFMKLNLIDNLILNIDSVIIGKGIKLFNEKNFDVNLKLLKIRKLNKNIIQFYYKVIK